MKQNLRPLPLATLIGMLASFALSAQPGIYFEPWPLDVNASNVRLYIDLSSPQCNCPGLSNINADDNPPYIWTWLPNDERPPVNGMDLSNGAWADSNENMRMWPDDDNPNLWYYDFLGLSLTQFYSVAPQTVHHYNVHFLVKEKNGFGNTEPITDLVAYTQSVVPETNIGTIIDFELFSTGSGPEGTNLVWSGVQNDARLFRLSGSKVVAVDAEGSILNPAFLDVAAPAGSDTTLHAFTGMAFSPNFSENGHLFTYKVMAHSSNQLFNRISRYTISAEDPNQVDNDSEVVVLDFDQDTDENIAGHIEFGPDGYLYISTGDGGIPNDPMNRAQDLNNLLGKILRIDVSSLPYSIPADNPFVPFPNTRPEVWHRGLRFPGKFAFEQVEGYLYFTDSEPNGWQKVIQTHAGGANGGWSCLWNGPVNPQFCLPGQSFINPFSGYTPNPANQPDALRCSVTGGRVYQGSEHPQLTGSFIYSDKCSNEYWQRLILESFIGMRKGPNLLSAPGLTAMSNNNTGEIFAVSNENANIYKMYRPCADYTATISQTGDNLQVQANFSGSNMRWYVNGIPLYNPTSSSTILPQWDGIYQAAVRSPQGCEVVSNALQIGTLSTSVKSASDIRLYPNPTTHQLQVHGSTATSSFEVYSLDGKRMQVNKAPGMANEQVIDVSTLAPGFYLLRINGLSSHPKVLSFVKQ